jgi:Type IV secretion-system coupling protein DNA-binding domain
MLTQIQERRQSAIVIDPDCEFVQEFYNEQRGDVVLNPLDALPVLVAMA